MSFSGRLLSFDFASFKLIVKGLGGPLQSAHAGSILFGTGLQVMIRLGELLLLGLDLVGRALCGINRRLQGRCRFVAQSLHLGFKTIHVHASALGHATRFLQQLLGNRGQTGELLIHLRQRLLQTLVEPCVLSFNGRERFVHHGFGVLQCDLNLGFGLVQHFVQCSTGFVQRGIDLYQCLVEQLTQANARHLNLFAQARQVGVQLVELGLHGISRRRQLIFSLIDQGVGLPADLVNFVAHRLQSLVFQAQHLVVQNLNFFLWRSLGHKIVPHRNDLVNQRLRLGLDGRHSSVQFLGNFYQFFLSGHQGGLQLRQQRNQFVNGQLDLCNDLTEHISEHIHRRQRLVKQTVSGLASGFQGHAGGCNGGLDGWQTGFNPHEQNPRRHQRGSAHHVTGANGDGFVTQAARLVQFGAGGDQGLVTAGHKIGNLGLDLSDQGLSGIDLICHHAEALGQRGHLRLDAVDLLAQLRDGLAKAVQRVVHAGHSLV